MKLEPAAWIDPYATNYIVGDEAVMMSATSKKHAKFTAPLYTIPNKHVVVPVEPTEAMWGELARDIMFVLRQERPTPRKLLYHLEHLHETLPDWLRNESEMQNLDHVISKGTCCVLIYKAMIAAKEQQ